jgi:hypothetical protein
MRRRVVWYNLTDISEMCTASLFKVKDKATQGMSSQHGEPREESMIQEQAQRAACFAYTSILKVEAVCSSETLVNFYQTA